MIKDIAETEVVLSARSLHKSYKNMEALTDFSFTMRAGEIIGLLGPNGAGKTTAMRILSTIFPPDQGDFSVMGIPYTRTEEIRALIGVLPESMGFPAYMTGEEYLTYMGRLYGHSPQNAEAKAVELLALFGLAIAREIVRLHQGDIDVQSEPGQGVTVTVYLPVERSSIHSRNDI